MLLVRARILELNGILRKPCSSVIKICLDQMYVKADVKGHTVWTDSIYRAEDLEVITSPY